MADPQEFATKTTDFPGRGNGGTNDPIQLDPNAGHNGRGGCCGKGPLAEPADLS